ncbi:MAG: hypothetical protein WCO56_22580 [Verrucomicrobiota bacterium]
MKRITGKSINYIFLTCAVFAMQADAASTGPGVPVSLINYSPLPVHATAVALEEALLCQKLGVPAGTPLHVRRVDQAQTIPMTRGTEDGRAVLRIYVSLPATSRLDLVAERAERWTEAQLAEAKPEGMKNGVLRFALGKKGWNLGFESGKATVIEDGALDFWIDNQNRGRIMNISPKDLWLVQYADSVQEKCDAAVTPDGQPAIRIVRRLGGFAKDMTVVETFELVPGLPLLICRVRWQNDSDKPLWVAYAGSGDGVKGRWSKELMVGPLLERKKSPIQADINGGETRPAWIGQLCRISMESPATGCGVGMSTLLPTPGKVGQGSMIWGCGASGFQCNFIDPVQGQFPFLVKPHEALDNGFVFLIEQTGVSVFRQTVDLWQALQKGKLPRLSPPCAVFVGGEAIHPQTVTGLGGDANTLRLLQTNGAVRQAALRMDFNKYFQGHLTVAAGSPSDAMEISALPMSGSKKPVTLFKAGKPGEYDFDLNQPMGKPDELPFILAITASGTARVTKLAITEVLPVSPQLISPMPDASFTDIATMFRWAPIPMVVDFDLQWSQSPGFAPATGVRISDSRDTPWYLPPADTLPKPGRWYWRMRGVKGNLAGAWSETRSFTVNRDYAPQPLKRTLTANSPLFTIEASKVTDYANFQTDIPADIAPFTAVIVECFVSKNLNIADGMRGVEKLPCGFLIRSHPPTWLSLADLEWVCQHMPNFLGIQGGETLSGLSDEARGKGKETGDADYYRRMTRICAKYGRFYHEADGTYKDDKWQDLMDKQGAFVREFGPWLVFSQKNNIIRRQFYSQSCAMGLWLGGVSHQHGAWEDGGFYWQNAGFNGLGVCAGERTGVLKTMPRIFWTLNFVMGISRGCGIYSLDGQTLMFSPKEAERWGQWPPAIWDTTGKTTDTFKRFVVPLIRGTIKHQLIPTKEQVLQKVKLAVYNDIKGGGDGKAWPHYVEYGPLYAATYGFRKMGNIDGQLWEFFPNTGRYYYIPVLPQGKVSLGANVQSLPVSQLQEVAQVKRVFDAAYPASYKGDALVCRIGDTVTVQNTRENEDVTESYSLPLNTGSFTKLAGKVGPHAYLVGKIEDQGRRLWLQANTEYPERDTEVTIGCTRKLEWQIEPATAAKEARWDEKTGTITLRLSHQQGAVEVTLR